MPVYYADEAPESDRDMITANKFNSHPSPNSIYGEATESENGALNGKRFSFPIIIIADSNSTLRH